MRDFEQQLKINEITSKHFYYVMHLLSINLSELSKFAGKSDSYFRQRKHLSKFGERDVRLLKAYIEEKYGKGVFEDKVYQAHLEIKHKPNYHVMINLIDNQNYEIERLKNENERLIKESREQFFEP